MWRHFTICIGFLPVTQCGRGVSSIECRIVLPLGTASKQTCTEEVQHGVSMSMSMSIKIFNVPRIAELSWSPRRRSRRTILGKDWQKGMFLDVDRRLEETRTIGFRWQWVPAEWCSDWKWASTDGCEPEWWNKQLIWWWRAKSATTGQVGDMNRSFRYGGGARPCSTRNVMTATLKSTRCGIDAANVELQGRPRHDRNDLVETLDECGCIYQSHGSGICVLNADNNFWSKWPLT